MWFCVSAYEFFCGCLDIDAWAEFGDYTVKSTGMKPWGLGFHLTVTSVIDDSFLEPEFSRGSGHRVSELEEKACLFNITKMLCWEPLLTH